MQIRIRYLGYIALASLVGWVGCGWLWLTFGALETFETKETRTHTRHTGHNTSQSLSRLYIGHIYIYIYRDIDDKLKICVVKII